MQPSSVHYLPLGPLFFAILALLFAMAVALVEIGLFHYTYAKMGIDRRYVYALLLASLFGSYINIPIAELPGESHPRTEVVSFFGVRYQVPVIEDVPQMVLAVNVGGALIPTIVSIYLLAKNRLWIRGGVAGEPVHGVGIAVPTLIPPVVAALVAVALSRQSAAPLAYVAGSMGTLIGADLLNLHLLPTLGASVASIGGAGTFDGVFLAGILAVLLAW
jgi:uncharacterized membrane protein